MFIIDKHNKSVERDGIYAFKSTQMEPYFRNGTVIIKYVRGVTGDRVTVNPDQISINGKVRGQGLCWLINWGCRQPGTSETRLYRSTNTGLWEPPQTVLIPGIGAMSVRVKLLERRTRYGRPDCCSGFVVDGPATACLADLNFAAHEKDAIEQFSAELDQIKHQTDSQVDFTLKMKTLHLLKHLHRKRLRQALSQLSMIGRSYTKYLCLGLLENRKSRIFSFYTMVTRL